MISLYRIAEQCRQLTEKRVSIQVLTAAVVNAYGYVAKKIYWENLNFDEQEVDGSFLTVFQNIEPVLDCDRDIYFITLPSTYLILPHQAGIAMVSYMKDKEGFIKVDNYSVYEGLKSSVFGGLTPYQPEGSKLLFPTMNAETAGPLLLKLAIAYDAIDPYEQLNIGPNIVNDIIQVVVAPYMNKQNPIEKIREIIN